MPRPQRICIPGLPHHIVQRGNNRSATFYHGDDYEKYLTLLGKAAIKHNSVVHAYVLMTNHVHLLVSPSSSDGLSLTMQTLGRRFVNYINKRYRRTGTLWKGRFKCSVVDSEHYCLACYRYIDLNPVRAAMVADPIDYRWSSCRHNVLGESNSLLTPHASYLELGLTLEARTTQYRSLIDDVLDEQTVNSIRYAVNKGLPAGSERFKADIEKHLGRQLATGKVGRPAKN